MRITRFINFLEVGRACQIGVLVAFACAGCASSRMTDSKRAGIEQLLISTAIDSSLDKIDFAGLEGGAVFVDGGLLDCTDANYVIGSVRQRAFEAGCKLVDKAAEADVVLELYSGAVGTDRSEGFIGTPALSVPGPFPVQLPEIKLFSQTTQYGTAKLGVVAYDAKSKRALASGGLTRARSDDRNWSILGVGPFNSGSLRDEYELTKQLDPADDRLVLSEPPESESTSQYSTYPTPPLYDAPTEITIPGSMQIRTYQPAVSTRSVGSNNLSRLPPWETGKTSSMPNIGTTTR